MFDIGLIEVRKWNDNGAHKETWVFADGHMTRPDRSVDCPQVKLSLPRKRCPVCGAKLYRSGVAHTSPAYPRLPVPPRPLPALWTIEFRVQHDEHDQWVPWMRSDYMNYDWNIRTPFQRCAAVLDALRTARDENPYAQIRVRLLSTTESNFPGGHRKQPEPQDSFEECDGCEQYGPHLDEDAIPAGDDDKAWSQIEFYHRDTCWFAVSRADQLDLCQRCWDDDTVTRAVAQGMAHPLCAECLADDAEGDE